MININLLPEVLRKKERMPLPQFFGMCAVIGILGFLGYMITKYKFDTIPSLTSRMASLQRQQKELKAQADELVAINKEIAQLNEHVEAVKTLYQNRIIWSKVLSDIKHIVNFDTTMSELNPEMRYLWLTKLEGRNKTISLDAYATANTQVVAMQMPERLFQNFLSYTPISLPEKDEEARLQQELTVAMADYDVLRRDNPELPLQGPEEVKIRTRLDEIKNVTSGGIAMMPFSSLLKPGSLTLVNATWTTAPQPPRTSRGGAITAEGVFPSQAWSFKVSMELK